MTNFINPTQITPDDLSNLFVSNSDIVPESTESNLELNGEEEQIRFDIKDKSNPDNPTNFSIPDISEDNKDSKDIKLKETDKEDEENKLEISLDVDNKDKEENKDIDYETVINTLSEHGLIEEAYEGFEDEEIKAESLVKLLEHNFDKKLDQKFDEFFEPLTDYTKRVLQFDLNTKGKDKGKQIESYLTTLIEEQNIKNLSVDNEYDQEKIIKQWYTRKENFTQTELEEKITELKDAGLLDKESRRLKPKLDAEAANIAKSKEEEQRHLREIEEKVQEVYNERILETLKKGKVRDISLTEKEVGDLYSILTGDETIEMTLPNKTKAKMSPLDAHIFFNKYAKEGSLENLILATLLLTNPAKFEKEYSKKMETKVARKFVEEHKYSNSLKGGKGEQQTKTTFTQRNREAKWPSIPE